MSPQVQLEADRISLINGADKAGRPCLVVTAANLIVSDRSVDDCTRSICYALDCACEQVSGVGTSAATVVSIETLWPTMRLLHLSRQAVTFNASRMLTCRWTRG
jgi:hypothetical protein